MDVATGPAISVGVPALMAALGLGGPICWAAGAGAIALASYFASNKRGDARSTQMRTALTALQTVVPEASGAIAALDAKWGEALYDV